MGSGRGCFTFTSLVTFGTSLPIIFPTPLAALMSEPAGLAEHMGELATSKLMVIVVISFVSCLCNGKKRRVEIFGAVLTLNDSLNR